MQRSAPLPANGQQVHQLPMGRFVQGVERQPAAGGGNRRFIVTALMVKDAYSFEGDGELLAQTISLEKLPLIKVRAIRQGEAA